jgi:arylsulfatase A-like enzyme
MYGPETFKPVQRSEEERKDPNPVYSAFMNMEVSESFSDDKIRETVLPAYMGLVKQIDDNLGRLFDHLEATGKADETMIVFTADHGDYMGDHWMGEKELFHDISVKVPMIIFDPRKEADATRGTASDALIEAIDLVPTFLEATGAPSANHRIEGISLQPLLHGQGEDGRRDAVFSEIDYAFYAAREALDIAPSDARAYMIRSKDWKYVHFRNYPPQLFDLNNDPQEFIDLGQNPDYKETRTEMHMMLFDRLTSRKNRVTMTDEQVLEIRKRETTMGIIIGKWE